MPTFIQTENAAQSAEKLALAVAQNLRDTLEKQAHATLAVSGGKSPIAFFQALNQQDLDWARVQIALVDERVVPTSHADSNTGLVRQHLLQNQASAAKYLPMIADHADEGSLKNINQAIEFALQNYVQPDVLVLGMGADGHTASIFPQAPQFDDAIRADYPQTLIHTTPVTAPHERISMTLAAIEATPFVYLAIAGAEKKAVYEQALLKKSQEYPISYVLNSEKVNANVFYNN
ncbi:6-phosphogluconolactonase [Alysiella filiformis]|uniref:6-phosphogluconolactonase n=1 Tax=Alysiella filiformis DSM 16848 TaxID=1120981 RepID=A0A286EWD8_9NEIS|nr:6-phosphogluconolactonase [Alysiella filiformis]QMT32003.1 6-phosphogluconolactonase [Alysiella filiformis]UBQ57089.1 6-phosphogluconolactonase [Alysiella filiformis DSM 16848]SOD75252.1 6-phosphogluconolactonase [Alysiella filiformis DSM 16848]